MKNTFDQLVKGNIKKHDNFLKIAIGQGDKYITSCLLELSQ